MLENTFSVDNQLGLHARAAAKLVSVASRHSSTITVCLDQRQVDARSIMGLLTLGAARGTLLSIIVDGTDEQAAMEEIAALFQNKFDED